MTTSLREWRLMKSEVYDLPGRHSLGAERVRKPKDYLRGRIGSYEGRGEGSERLFG